MLCVKDIPRGDRVVAVFSDIEMGSGGPKDDFPHSPFLADLLSRYMEPPYLDRHVDLVFNGDTFDLLKTPYLGSYPHHISADVAIAKMASVASVHPRFFEVIRALVQPGDGRVQVHFVVGNHDAELSFPQVQAFLAALCGRSPQVHVAGFGLDLGPVYCEHGQQADILFAQDPDNLFVEHQGRQLLNIAWASVALLDAVIPLHREFAFYERLVDALLEAGISPWLMLFHWDYPQALFCRGGWLNPDSPDWFAEYASKVVGRLGDRVAHWFTIEEPPCFVGLGHYTGEHAPGLKLDLPQVLQMGHHALLAHGKGRGVLAGAARGLRKSKAHSLAVPVLFALLFRDAFKASGASEALRALLSGVPLPEVLALTLLCLALGLMTGSAMLSITVLPSGLSLAEVLPIYTGAVVGYVISPLHLCFIVSAEYFGLGQAEMYPRLAVYAVLTSGASLLAAWALMPFLG